MNNSHFSFEKVNLSREEKPDFTDRETHLIGLVEKLRRIAASEDWSSLKKELFDGVVLTLEKQLQSEASKDDPDTQVLARINGQLVWANKYADLNKLADIFMGEVNSIRKYNGKTQEKPGDFN